VNEPPKQGPPSDRGELPPELEPGEVPFEKPRRFERTRKLIRRVSRKRERPPSPAAIAAFVLIYFGGGIGVQFADHGFLLFAWTMTGPLAISVYMTYEGRGSLLNPFTLFFSSVLLGSVGAHFIRG
jgi:hypothetical protein